MATLLIALAGCSSALIDPPDGGDSSVSDSTVDAGDTGTIDTGGSDTGGVDSGTTDTGTPDTAMPDGGPLNPGVGEIVISEIMPDSHAVGDTLGEWFELHNPSSTTAYSLAGCTFYDRGGAIETITSLLIAPGDYVSLAISPSPGFTPDYVYTSGMRLSNDRGGDMLTVACRATIVDAVAYLDTWPWGQGDSLNLDPSSLDAAANDLESSWCPGTMVYNSGGGDDDHGTPGAPNRDCP